MKKWVITLAGLCVSVLAIALVVSKAELDATATLIASVGYRVPFLLAGMYLATFPICALRWQCMLPAGTLSFIESLKGVLVGFAGNNFLPTRGGEFLRMEYLYRKAPQIGRITAISSILVERMLDGLTLLAILVLACTHRTWRLPNIAGWANCDMWHSAFSDWRAWVRSSFEFGVGESRP